jgi:anaerobic dimethyl sulfoxide reductase subunit C (anchor subunit)
MEVQIELMTFTLFVCLAAGTFCMLGLLTVLGKGKTLQLPALICSLVALVIGGVGSFLHLQHWERLFNGFGHITSGITQEFIAIAVFFVGLVVYFIFMRRSEDGVAPKWAAVIAIIVSVALVIIMALSYNMASRPAWNTPLLWLYYLSNAAFFGALALSCIAGLKGETELDVAKLSLRLTWIFGIVALIVTIAYALFISSSSGTFSDVGYYFDATHPNKPMADAASATSGILTGSTAMLFWGGVIAIGYIVPIALAFVAQNKAPLGKVVAVCAGGGLICALIGGICFRIILYTLAFSVFVFY